MYTASFMGVATTIVVIVDHAGPFFGRMFPVLIDMHTKHSIQKSQQSPDSPVSIDEELPAIVFPKIVIIM